MGRPPLILVSPSIEKHGVEFHDLSASLSVRYDAAVLAAGGLPVAEITFRTAAAEESIRAIARAGKMLLGAVMIVVVVAAMLL